jgi:hypothetical protein
MYDSQNGETDCDRGLPLVYDARWRQPVRLKKRTAGRKLSPSGRAATSILNLRLTQSKSHEIVREFPAS